MYSFNDDFFIENDSAHISRLFSKIPKDIYKFHLRVFEYGYIKTTYVIDFSNLIIFPTLEEKTIFEDWWKTYTTYYKNTNTNAEIDIFIFMDIPKNTCKNITIIPIHNEYKEWFWITQNCNNAVFRFSHDIKLWAFESETDAALFILAGIK